MTISQRKRWSRHVAGAVAVAVIGVLLAGGTPALAAPAVGGDDVSQPTSRSTGPVGLASTGGFTARQVSRSSGAAPMAIPDPDAEAPGCNAYVIASSNDYPTQVAGPPGVPPETVEIADVMAWGELECTAGLLSVWAQTRIFDRTPGFNDNILALGNIVQRSSTSEGIMASRADVRLYDEWQDNGRAVEGILELKLRLPGAFVWTSCTSAPGVRLIACSGLNTTLLHVLLGTFTEGTGLKPPVVRYVALGDSFASGVNGGAYDASPSTCRRSANGYHRRLAWLRTSAGLEIQPPLVRACSAARIEHINATQAGAEAPQISAVNARSTRLVTVQMGGNDLGFGNTLIQCYLIICNGPLVTPAELQATQVRLTAMYRQILSTMRSGGTLAVLTYPAIIPRPGEPSCPAIDNFFSAAERTALDEAWAAGAEMIKRAAAAVGDPQVRVVDLYNAFAGHKICSPQGEYASAFVGLTDSFHPNADGYRETARRIQQTLGLTGVVL